MSCGEQRLLAGRYSEQAGRAGRKSRRRASVRGGHLRATSFVCLGLHPIVSKGTKENRGVLQKNNGFLKLEKATSFCPISSCPWHEPPPHQGFLAFHSLQSEWKGVEGTAQWVGRHSRVLWPGPVWADHQLRTEAATALRMGI